METAWAGETPRFPPPDRASPRCSFHRTPSLTLCSSGNHRTRRCRSVHSDTVPWSRLSTQVCEAVPVLTGKGDVACCFTPWSHESVPPLRGTATVRGLETQTVKPVGLRSESCHLLATPGTTRSPTLTPETPDLPFTGHRIVTLAPKAASTTPPTTTDR